MTTFMKNGIEVCMPEDDEKSRQNMIIAAEFMARMIQKYGKKVLARVIHPYSFSKLSITNCTMPLMGILRPK